MRFDLKNTATLELPKGKRDHIEFDSDVPGFGLRLRESGSRTWIYQYRIGRKQRRLSLGNAKLVPLALAKESAAKAVAEIRLGGDPATKKVQAKCNAENTFEALAEQYLKTNSPWWRPRSLSEFSRHLKTVAKPLHKLPITAVTQEDIAALLKTVVKNSGDVSANRVRTTLSAFFAWVLGKGVRLPEGNPVSNTNVREEVPRDRVLSEAELKIIWNACRDDDYGNVIKLLILTGQRRGEIAGLLWDEVNDDQLVLSAHRVKNKRAHVVPLSAPAKAIIANVRIFGVGRKHVFGREDNSFQGWTLAKRGLEKRLARSVPDWTVHDIRRSVATHMAEKLGVQPHIIEAVLNHISGSKSGIAGMYNRATYDYRKREALDNWGAYVTAIVTGATANVWSQKRA